jgi:hypothetical protein
LPRLKIEYFPVGNKKRPTERMILWRALPHHRTHAGYGGVRYHATKRTIWWCGTITTPPTFGVMVVWRCSLKLHIEQWRKIGGVADPR